MKDDRQGRIPFEYALDLYSKQHWTQIQNRLNSNFIQEENVFLFKLLGEPCKLSWPEGKLTAKEGTAVSSYVIRILVLRYFALGIYVKPTGRKITYKEIKDGAVYYPNFKKRTVDRLAREFDENNHLLDVGGKDLGLGERSVEIEVIDHVPLTYVCWAGDDEFPASANILFDETIEYYFNAEDLAVLPDLGIVWLKRKGALPLDFGMYDE